MIYKGPYNGEMSAKKLTDRFLQMEKDYNMFDITIQGRKVWPYLRLQCGRILIKSFLDRNIDLSYGSGKSYAGKMTTGIWFEKHIRRNSLILKKKDILIVSFFRKKEVADGVFRDEVTYYLNRYLKRSHYVWDRNVQDSLFQLQECHNVKSFNRFKYTYTFGKVYSKVLADVDELDQVFTPIESVFSIELENNEKRRILSVVNAYLFEYERLYDYCKYVIKRVKPKVIVLVDGGMMTSQLICIVADELNIPTIELAHCFATSSHIFYNNLQQNVKDFPKYYFSFGDYDKEIVRWAIPNDNVIPVGLPVLDEWKKIYKTDKTDKKEGNIILIISSLREELYECAKELALKLDEKYQIKLKLHPQECSGWKIKVRPIVKDSRVEVIDSADLPIYAYLSEATWVIGTDSSALYEATAFNTQIAVLLSSKNEEDFLVRSGLAVGFSCTDQLVSRIKNEDEQHININADSLYKPNSLKNMEAAIESIIARETRK